MGVKPKRKDRLSSELLTAIGDTTSFYETGVRTGHGGMGPLSNGTGRLAFTVRRQEVEPVVAVLAYLLAQLMCR